MLQFDALCGAKNFEQLKKIPSDPIRDSKNGAKFDTATTETGAAAAGIIGCHLPDTQTEDGYPKIPSELNLKVFISVLVETKYSLAFCTQETGTERRWIQI